MDRRGLDDLIKFINGAEDMGMGGPSRIDRNDKISGKAAKRQRQKQRKVCVSSQQLAEWSDLIWGLEMMHLLSVLVPCRCWQSSNFPKEMPCSSC